MNKKIIITILALLIISISIFIYLRFNKKNMENNIVGALGHRIVYKKNIPIIFPDFTLIFKDLEKIQGPNNAKFYINKYYFILSNSNNTKEIIWSSGTGDVAPSSFEFNFKKYIIELRYSEKNGNLGENELVITQI